MRLAIPVAGYHRGNTSDYILRAASQLGHTADILNIDGFTQALKQHSISGSNSYDLFLCVDSGLPINLVDGPLSEFDLGRVAYWFIDFRHNKNRTTRIPNDLENARALHNRGGWVLQAQYEDYQECQQLGLKRSAWLPLAADPEIWSDQPPAQKQFDLGFIGHVWDEGRAQILTLLLRQDKLRFLFNGQKEAWCEDGARLLRICRAGFNVNSFFGAAHAFDVNMRVFETLSCGIPLITNEVEGLWRLFDRDSSFIRTYRSGDDLVQVLANTITDSVFWNSGNDARRCILQSHTYVHRLTQALDVVGLG